MFNLIIEMKYSLNCKSSISQRELATFIENMDSYFVNSIKSRDYFLDYEKIAANFLKNANIVLCRNDDSEILGLVAFYADPKCYDLAYEAYVAVIPQNQSQGIGRTLINEEIIFCKKIGMKGIMTNCEPENKRKAKLNLRLGFSEINNHEELLKFRNMNDKWKNKRFYKLIF